MDDGRRRSIRNFVLVAAALLAVTLFGPRMCSSPLLAAGTAAPPFSVTRIVDARRVTLGDLRGRPAVLFFWAAWCKACKEMMPGLAALAAERPDTRFVAVHGDGGVPPSEQAAKARSYPALEFAEGGERFLGVYRVTTFPTTYVLDADGRICGGLVGRTSGDNVARLLDHCGS